MQMQKVLFRLFEMPCCHTMICWVNPRLPNYCPECGNRVYIQLKGGRHTHVETPSWLCHGDAPPKKSVLKELEHEGQSPDGQ